jgi:hypothetical protein
MAVVRNLLGLTSALSVQIGSLWHDSMTLEHALHKFCKHIFVVTGDEQFPYSFRGSGTALKIAGRHFPLLLSSPDWRLQPGPSCNPYLV